MLGCVEVYSEGMRAFIQKSVKRVCRSSRVKALFPLILCTCLLSDVYIVYDNKYWVDAVVKENSYLLKNM